MSVLVQITPTPTASGCRPTMGQHFADVLTRTVPKKLFQLLLALIVSTTDCALAKPLSDAVWTGHGADLPDGPA